MTNSSNVTQEILGLEKKYWKAMQDHDLKTAVELTDFPCVVAGAHGLQAVDQKAFEKMFNSQSQESIRTFDFDEQNVQVRLVTPETAIVAYQVRTQFTKDNKDKDMKAVDTSTWIKRDNKWVCAMHTETELTKQ